jgi:hypothetical protein
MEISNPFSRGFGWVETHISLGQEMIPIGRADERRTGCLYRHRHTSATADAPPPHCVAASHHLRPGVKSCAHIAARSRSHLHLRSAAIAISLPECSTYTACVAPVAPPPPPSEGARWAVLVRAQLNTATSTELASEFKLLLGFKAPVL